MLFPIATLKPFFSYFGSKWSVIDRYPRPRHRVIIEPFAGSASYSLWYPWHEVKLFDKYDVICGVWDYLIHSSEADIRALPSDFEHLDDVVAPQEAKDLIGLNLNRGSSQPKKSFTAWRDHTAAFWGDAKKERIIRQQSYIRHWKVERKSFEEIPNDRATWFIDPPYESKLGSHYKHNNKRIDFGLLKTWIEQRRGQFICCEIGGATWAPFKDLVVAHGFKLARDTEAKERTYTEAIWQGENYDT